MANIVAVVAIHKLGNGVINRLECQIAHGNGTQVSALAYFAEPEDLIPDRIPGLGFLDDAIMVELVVRELRPELDAYADFCKFRKSRPKLLGKSAAPIDREQWLDGRRKQLQSRMRRRRRPAFGARSGPSLKLW